MKIVKIEMNEKDCEPILFLIEKIYRECGIISDDMPEFVVKAITHMSMDSVVQMIAGMATNKVEGSSTRPQGQNTNPISLSPTKNNVSINVNII